LLASGILIHIPFKFFAAGRLKRLEPAGKSFTFVAIISYIQLKQIAPVAVYLLETSCAHKAIVEL
jgi:hypothetical protein